MSNESGFDSFEPNYTYDEVVFDTFSGAVFIVIFIFSVTGNILLLCVLFNYENLKNVTNLFVLNLACSDLVFTFTLPFWAVYFLHHWIFGDFACKFMAAMYFSGLYSSVILLTAMTVDRFITVVLHHWPSRPVRRQRCAMAACAAAWVISTGASVSDAMNVEVNTVESFSECTHTADTYNMKLGYYLQVSLLFFLPFAIIVFCYSAILKTVLQASNRRRYRTVVVVLCIVTAFFICWGPYHILLFIQPFYELDFEEDPLYTVLSVCKLLAYSHCCMNPLLYMLSQKLRGHLLKLLRCKNARRNNREKGTGQSTSIYHNVAFIAQNSAVLLELPPK